MVVLMGYKETGLGVIPKDWDISTLENIVSIDPENLDTSTPDEYEFTYISLEMVDKGKLLNVDKIKFKNSPSRARRIVRKGDILFSTVRPNLLSHLYIKEKTQNLICSTGFSILRADADIINPEYIYQHLFSGFILRQIERTLVGSNYPALSSKDVAKLLFPLPKLPEQTAVANVLARIDDLIASLEKLIAKKKAVKQGAMQELLTGKKRLPGFSGEYEWKSLSSLCYILDSCRVPIKKSERMNIEGSIPYCGANGVIGYVNDFTIDDHIILIAEDGGYFDEFFTRPIAYKMSGKCWVNNHAHIIKAKEEICQEYVFQALVHKNILPYISSGTRAKLNQAELQKIEIAIPLSFIEQQTISETLSNMDNEIEQLEHKLRKYQCIKTGMMQDLLTGKIRLPQQ